MKPDARIRFDAAEWLARRDRGLDTAETAMLAEWLECDPRHGEALARISAAWALGDKAKACPELVALAGELDAPRRSHRRTGAALWTTASLAAAAAFAFAFWIRSRPASRGPASSDYRVIVAEARTVRLSDGSVVEVKAGGDITEQFSAGVRQVALSRGEARFAVAPNAERPFVVALGPVAVRDIGTVFDVCRRNSEIDILVTEGEVAVEDARGRGYPASVPALAAGQMARVTLDAAGDAARVAIEAPSAADIDRDLAWRSTWLVFDRTPLASAVEAFNAQGSPRLVLGDPSLADRRLGGTFRADNVDAFVRLLQDSLDVRSDRGAQGEIILLPAR